VASQYGSTATVLVLLEYGAQVDILLLDDVRVHNKISSPYLNYFPCTVRPKAKEMATEQCFI
jgi:hypothetical protein